MGMFGGEKYRAGASPVTADCLSLASALSLHGHASIDVLKINIDGAEFDLFTRNDSTSMLPPFDQILVDMRKYNESMYWTKTLNDVGYFLVHKHGDFLTFLRKGEQQPLMTKSVIITDKNDKEYSSNYKTSALKRKYTALIDSVSSKILSLVSHKQIKSDSWIFLVIFNTAYIDFTLSWICNMHSIGYSEEVLSSTVFLATDHASYHRFQEFPDFNTILFEVTKEGNLSYGSEDYFFLMLLRTWLVQALLHRGVKLALIETDAFWTGDPLKFINNIDADIISADNVVKEFNVSDIGEELIQEPGRSRSGQINETSMRNSKKYRLETNGQPSTGFMFFKSTNATKRFWDIVSIKHENLISSGRGANASHDWGDEMKIINNMWWTAKNIKLHLLDTYRFTSGLWYENEFQKHRKGSHVIQNNWIVGNENKRNRAKLFKHWFLDASNRTCIAPKIVLHVLTFSRSEALKRLLKNINAASYPSVMRVDLLIHIDKSALDGSVNHSVLSVAEQAQWLHGTKNVLINPEHRGIVGQWLDCWQPSVHDNDNAVHIILEDDMELSKEYSSWFLSAAHFFRNDNSVAAITGQMPQLRARGEGDMRDVLKPAQEFIKYRLMATWSLAPVKKYWM